MIRANVRVECNRKTAVFVPADALQHKVAHLPGSGEKGAGRLELSVEPVPHALLAPGRRSTRPGCGSRRWARSRAVLGLAPNSPGPRRWRTWGCAPRPGARPRGMGMPMSHRRSRRSPPPDRAARPGPEQPPVSTTPDGMRVLEPASLTSWRARFRISSTRGSMISHRILRETSRGRRPPTLGTLITSSLGQEARRWRRRSFFLIRSASSKGVRRPDRDVVRDVVAAEAQHRGVLDRSLGEDGDVGGPAADVDQAHTRGPARRRPAPPRPTPAARARCRSR